VLLLEVCIFSFLVALFIAPMLITFLRKQKAKQTIYSYVENHKIKQGTPTMGGLIFIFAITFASLVFFRKENTLGVFTIIVCSAFGLTGFLDDFIKVKYKQNLGLRAYQKFLFQFAISIAIAIFAYNSNLVGSVLIVPFTTVSIDIGWWAIPLIIFVFVAITNSVNLTDGLDGLAGTCSLVVILAFFCIISIMRTFNLDGGGSYQMFYEYQNVLIVASSSVGALMCFLLFNSYPAKIFMGDTGSLFLGALIGCLGIFTRLTLIIPILCAVFVASTLSVIIQVLHFRRTKKRIFLMAPLHHHFEKKGVHEVKIVASYVIITTIIGLISVLLMII